MRSAATTSAPSTLAWRRDRLTAAGFTLPVAMDVARDPRYDLHRLIELVERGCPPALAARILQPPDDDGEAA
jgi:hypothetical protein